MKVAPESTASGVLSNEAKVALIKSRKANLETDHNPMGLSNTVKNSLKKQIDHTDEARLRVKDKADRATVENCLDPRTMI